MDASEKHYIKANEDSPKRHVAGSIYTNIQNRQIHGTRTKTGGHIELRQQGGLFQVKLGVTVSGYVLSF